MTNSDVKQQILEMIYGLLPEDRAEMLRVRIEKEPELRKIYEELSRKNRLISEAAKLEPIESIIPTKSFASVPPKTSVPPKASVLEQENHPERPIFIAQHAKMTQIIHAPHPPKHGLRWITRELARRALGEERGVNRMITICAIGLLCFILAGLFYQKARVGHLSQLSHHLRVATPSILTEGQPQIVQIQVTDLTGRSQQVPVRITMNRPDGEKILAKTEQTDSSGQLQLTLEPRTDLPPEVDLEISAGENPDQKIVSRLKGQPQPLQLSASLGQDEQTRFRAFNVTQSVPKQQHDKLKAKLALKADSGEKPQVASARSAHSAPAASVPSSATPVVPAAPTLPAPFAAGGMSGMGDAMKMEAAQLKSEAALPLAEDPMMQLADAPLEESEADTALAETVLDESPLEAAAEPSKTAAEPLEVEFFPEGGFFVLGLENRIYFRANQDIRGKIVDQEDNTIASIESLVDGAGEFRLTPKAGNRYRLIPDLHQESSDDHQGIPIALSPKDLPIALGTGRTIFAAGESIVIHLRSKKNAVPVAVTISKQGMPIQTMTNILHFGLNTLDIPLDATVCGLLDVTVFDGSDPNLKVLAAQPVFRRPSQFLDLKVKHKVGKLPNGADSWNFDLQVVDETGKPSAATIIGVDVLQDDTHHEASGQPFRGQPTLADQFYFSQETGGYRETVDWETVDALLKARDTESDAKLGILIATQMNRPLESRATSIADLKPFLYDNLGDLQSEFQQKVSRFQDTQQSWTRFFMMTTIFGGMAFAVFVMILATMRLASMVRMFVLTTIVGLGCVFLCMAILQSQEVFVVMFEQPFVSRNMVAVDLKKKEQKSAAMNEAAATQKPEMMRDESSIDESGSADKKLLTVFNSISAIPSQATAAQDVFWQSSLETDANGRVQFDFTNNQPESSLTIIINAIATDGRVASFRLNLDRTKPSN